jgi:trehalose 6-phosphate phosphatase
VPVNRPDEVVERCLAAPRPLLVGLDVDGVLAPIVTHPEQARLLDGTADVVARLAAVTPVAVVSGRALDDLERRFRFPAPVAVVGSHGLEARDAPPLELDAAALTRLHDLAERAARVASTGDGLWVEPKPASVVLHVREATRSVAARAVDDLLDGLPSDVHVKHGHEVVELFAVVTSKADAVERLRSATRAASVAYFGDDRTDEEVFAALGASDVGVRVGPGDSVATFRLSDPVAVRSTLDELSRRLRTGSAAPA